MTMQFFQCPCPETGNVILDGNNQGPNKDGDGRLLTKRCNEGLHIISLQCSQGKNCFPSQARIEIKNTNPISPLQVPFKCVW